MLKQLLSTSRSDFSQTLIFLTECEKMSYLFTKPPLNLVHTGDPPQGSRMDPEFTRTSPAGLGAPPGFVLVDIAESDIRNIRYQISDIADI